MNSEKLYYKNRFMKEFDGTVVECTPDKKGFKIVLDRTCFYPEGGGQPTDKGTLTFGDDVANVSEVHEKGEVIYHYADKEIPIGTAVHGEIDWDRRFDLMQQHTGDHIISGIIYHDFGYNNVGFHLTEKELVIDYDGPLTKSDVEEIAKKANRYVWENQPVTASYPDNLDEMDYRSKVSLSGDVRIVKRGDADLCACCGTHVDYTSQAGPIFILSTQNFNGGIRIFAACGQRAINYMNQRNADCLGFSHALSSPVEKITDAFERRMKELENLKSTNGSLKRQMTQMLVDGIETDGEICAISQDNMDSADLQNMAIALSEKVKIAVCYSKDASARDKICIVAPNFDTNKLGKYISSVLGGKGGGKPGIYQGFLEEKTTANQLESLTRQFLKENQIN